MRIEYEMILRLLLAALFGALIGVEREYRAKEAGLRTHFMVCIGSAIFTIVSLIGFPGAEISRVAAQIVSGIGFIGAGMIVIQKRFVAGLTTAAGIWTTAAIGMAAGVGLYWIAAFGTVLTLIGFESLRRISHKIGHLKYRFEVSFLVVDNALAHEAKERLKTAGFEMKTYASSRALDGRIRVRLTLEVPEKMAEAERIYNVFADFPAAELENIE